MAARGAASIGGAAVAGEVAAVTSTAAAGVAEVGTAAAGLAEGGAVVAGGVALGTLVAVGVLIVVIGGVTWYLLSEDAGPGDAPAPIEEPGGHPVPVGEPGVAGIESAVREPGEAPGRVEEPGQVVPMVAPLSMSSAGGGDVWSSDDGRYRFQAQDYDVGGLPGVLVEVHDAEGNESYLAANATETTQLLAFTKRELFFSLMSLEAFADVTTVIDGKESFVLVELLRQLLLRLPARWADARKIYDRDFDGDQASLLNWMSVRLGGGRVRPDPFPSHNENPVNDRIDDPLPEAQGPDAETARASLEDPSKSQLIHRAGAADFWSIPGCPELAVKAVETYAGGEQTLLTLQRSQSTGSDTVRWVDAGGVERVGTIVANPIAAERGERPPVEVANDDVVRWLEAGQYEVVGTGTYNQVVGLPGGSQVVRMPLLAPGADPARFQERVENEMRLLIRLQRLGLPSLDPRIIRWTDPFGRIRVGIVMRRVDGAHNRDTAPLDNERLWRRYVKERTLQDLVHLQTMFDLHPYGIVDFQFMIDRHSGSIVVVDPLGLGDQPEQVQNTARGLAGLVEVVRGLLDGTP